MEIALLAVGLLATGLLVRALRRRREGRYADGEPPATDARGAVGRNSRMLGGGG